MRCIFCAVLASGGHRAVPLNASFRCRLRSPHSGGDVLFVCSATKRAIVPNTRLPRGSEGEGDRRESALPCTRRRLPHDNGFSDRGASAQFIREAVGR